MCPASIHVLCLLLRVCARSVSGCKIKALRAKTNTYIKTPVRGEEPVFVVTGRKEDVAAAKREILSAAEHFSSIRAQRKSNGLNAMAPGPNSNMPGENNLLWYSFFSNIIQFIIFSSIINVDISLLEFHLFCCLKSSDWLYSHCCWPHTVYINGWSYFESHKRDSSDKYWSKNSSEFVRSRTFLAVHFIRNGDTEQVFDILSAAAFIWIK